MLYCLLMYSSARESVLSKKVPNFLVFPLTLSGHIHVGHFDPHQGAAITAAQGPHVAPHDVGPVGVPASDLVAVPADGKLTSGGLINF